jgi:hypothetical protein
MVRLGMISPEDLGLYFRTNSVDEAFEHLTRELGELVLKKPGNPGAAT